MGEYFDNTQFGTGAQDRYVNQAAGAWHSGEMSNSLEQGVQQGTQLFKQTFRQLMGRDPTQDELGSYQVNALAGALPNGQNPGYGDLSGLAHSYINNQYGDQIAAAQQQKQTQAAQDQLKQTFSQGTDLVNQLNQSSQNYLMSPESQAQIQGGLNNRGMLNSGAYSQTLAGLMAQGANQNQASVLQGVGVPALSNIQGLSSISGNPYNQSMSQGQGAINDLNGIRNFNWEADLAKILGQTGQPSSAQNIMGMASGAAQGAGALGQGAGGAKSATQSYVCREMKKRRLLCESDLEDFYLHMFPAVWKKARAFWHYKINGQKLVDAVNRKPDADLIWKTMKPLLFDGVMAERDPIKAVNNFASACEHLCGITDYSLWDKKVYSSSIFDSLRFIPLLFTDKTFGKNFWRILRIKMLIVYDKPACQAHR